MKRKVLLVDDHPDIIDVVGMELEVLGFEVRVARNGLQAVEMATSEPPDLIVMDIILPKMDGMEAATRIRQNPRTRSVPILAATALCREEDKVDCLASGCTAHIAKPFTHRELRARIHQLLNAA